MFSIANLYNSACSNAVNPIRIHPIMMSIILHHYKMLKERTSSFVGFDSSLEDDINGYNTNHEDNIIIRLLVSILQWNINRDPNNFRLELISSIQNVIYNKILALTLMDENLGDSITNTIVNPDVGRALIWSRMFSARYKNTGKKKEDQAREPNRPIN